MSTCVRQFILGNHKTITCYGHLCRHHYIRNADFVANELEEEVERVLAQQAKETCQLLVDEKFKVYIMIVVDSENINLNPQCQHLCCANLSCLMTWPLQCWVSEGPLKFYNISVDKLCPSDLYSKVKMQLLDI